MNIFFAVERKTVWVVKGCYFLPNFARKIQILGFPWYLYVAIILIFFLSFRARWGGDFYAPSTVTDNILPLISHKVIQENFDNGVSSFMKPH